MKLLVIHGPNLNLLGTREPEVYGTKTLADLDKAIADRASERGAAVECFQSNHEGEIIDSIQRAGDNNVDAIILNPAAYTHTSMAILDALRASTIPVIEVHISNIHARPGRSRSVTARAATGIISGFGLDSYLLAIDAALGL